MIGATYSKRDPNAEGPARLRVVGVEHGGEGGEVHEPVVTNADEFGPSFAVDFDVLVTAYSRELPPNPADAISERLAEAERKWETPAEEIGV